MTKPTVQPVDLTEYDGMIHRMLRTIYNYNCSDSCLEYDDLFQMCRICVWEAIRDYDPTRGAKLSTFIHLKLHTQVTYLKRQIANKSNGGTINFGDLSLNIGKHSPTSKETETDPLGELHRSNSEEVQESMAELVDLMTVLERLPGFKMEMFVDYFIEGKSKQEIYFENDDLEYHQVVRELGFIENIFSTLVKGVQHGK